MIRLLEVPQDKLFYRRETLVTDILLLLLQQIVTVNTDRPAVMFKESVFTELSTAHVTPETLWMPLHVQSLYHTSYYPATTSEAHGSEVDSVTVVTVGSVLVLVEYALLRRVVGVLERLETLHAHKTFLVPMSVVGCNDSLPVDVL